MLETLTQPAEMEEGWAQLVSTTDLESDPVLLTKDKFIIGRLKTGTSSNCKFVRTETPIAKFRTANSNAIQTWLLLVMWSDKILLVVITIRSIIVVVSCIYVKY